MATAYDVSPADLIQEMAEDLKNFKDIIPPTWAPFVKTGVHKELPPEGPDWWYVRSAAVLRKIYLKGPMGVRKIQSEYGGRKNRGAKEEQFRRGSGSISRKILQQLEKAALVIQTDKGGRQITARGMAFVDEVARRISA